MKTGFVDLPLHPGTTPRWLFERMTDLSREISKVIIYEFGKDEFLRRLSDPFWFQGFACAIGFDWHSSGTTTVSCGALKQALNDENIGIAFSGGKGKDSINTPSEIQKFSEKFNLSQQKTDELIKASRLSAKIDNDCLQDAFEIYHHSFVLSEDGKWAVIQQGMNAETMYARRYHWLSENLKNYESFVNEPHTGISCDVKVNPLNMVAEESSNARKCSVDLAKEKSTKFYFIKQTTLFEPENFALPKHHEIYLNSYENLMKSERIAKALNFAYEFQPKNYEDLISIKGIGAGTVRALALLSDLVYGEKPSWKDPVKYSFAHGGKDGYPYKVSRKLLDKSIEILKTGLENAKIGDNERLNALRRLKEFLPEEI
ncbi:MAG: DUF763 domain-containing protein [Candidatus Altarchaeum sp.]|nr:DUF763 domain-containing protein [Candidatus Altarchaeum sp.]